MPATCDDGHIAGSKGKKTGLQSDLVRCTGATAYEDQYFGDVIATFDFYASVTPRGW